MLIRSPHNLPLPAAIFIVVWSGFTSTFCYFLTIPLKKVWVDDHYLYASNYLKEITIPLSEIADVTQLRVANVRPVTVYLKSLTEFGDKIKFIPHTEFRLWKEYSVVDELKALVKTYNEKGAFTQRAQANNSFNRSGLSLPFIENLNAIRRCFPPG